MLTLLNANKFITALLEVGYDGNLDIEHEDEIFARAAEKADFGQESNVAAMIVTEYSGLVSGYNHLSKLIPPEMPTAH